MAAVKRNAYTKITLSPILALLLFSSLTILQTFFFPLPLMTTAPFFWLCSGVQCLLFRGQTLQSQKNTATICEGVQNRKEGSSGWKLRFISQVRQLLLLHLCCSSPIIPVFLQTSQSFSPHSDHFLSLLSPFTFLSVPSYPSYFLGGDWQIWNLFWEEECWTCQNKNF